MLATLAFAVAAALAFFFVFVALDVRFGPLVRLAGALDGVAGCARGLTAVRTASRLDTRTESKAAVGAALSVATLRRFSRPVAGQHQSVILSSHWTALLLRTEADGDT
jgi:hypothetical protein